MPVRRRAEWIPIDLGELVASTVEQMLLLAADKGINVTCEARASGWSCWATARASSRSWSICSTTPSNTRPSDGSVHLRVRQATARRCLSVEDTGIGIPAEALPHVFERFYRVDATRSADTGGAGLGLAIVKTICDAHGAAVRVTSALGRGSSFQVSFPQ